MKRCEGCKHAVVTTNPISRETYMECSLQRKSADDMTLEELKYMIAHPEEKPCKYAKGKPKRCFGYDD